MNTEILNSLKIDLIARITKSDDEVFLHHIKDEFEERNEDGLTENQREMLKKLAKPIRKTIDLEELKREQNWKPTSSKEIQEIIEGFDWQISDEDFYELLENT